MFFQHFIRVGELLKHVECLFFVIHHACPCISRMNTNIFEKMCRSWTKWIWSMRQNSFEEYVKHGGHQEGPWISLYKACMSILIPWNCWGCSMEHTGKDPGYPSMKRASGLTQWKCWGCNMEDTGKDPGYPSMKHASAHTPRNCWGCNMIDTGKDSWIFLYGARVSTHSMKLLRV